MLTVPLQREDIERIGRIGRDRAPAEACGVLLPTPYRGSRVWEMPNRAPDHHDNFILSGEDVMISLGEWIHDNQQYWNKVVVWHTHPHGNTGPSDIDLKGRTEAFANLIVALTEEGPIPTFF